MTPVIFDNDLGIDDAMALLLLHCAESVDLVAITSRFGNASIENTTRNCLAVKEKFGIAAPVFQGAANPLGPRLGSGYPDHVHGADGLGNMAPASVSSQAESESAAAAMVRLTREATDRLTIVAVGGLTNIAEALALDTGFADRVEQLIIMGGAFGYNGHSGNVSPVAEANIASDPLAADRVFKTSIPKVIVGLDVTHEITMDTAYMQSLQDSAGLIGDFIERTHRYYLEFHRSLSGKYECPLHDSAAVAYLLAPELFKTIEQPVRAVCEGIAIGQTIHSNDLREYVSQAWNDIPASTLCIDVDAQAVLDLCLETLSKGT